MMRVVSIARRDETASFNFQDSFEDYDSDMDAEGPKDTLTFVQAEVIDIVGRRRVEAE